MPGRVLLVAAASLLLVAGPAIAAEQTAIAYIQDRYADAPEPGAKARYSPRIDKLWAACLDKEKQSGDPCMDFDIWVNAQDWEIENLEVEQIAADGGKAAILVRFDNFGRRETISYNLLKDENGWVVDEISTGCDTLSGVLKGEPSTAC